MRILPGRPPPVSLPAPTATEERLRPALERDVSELAEVIGERHLGRPQALERAAGFVARRLGESGLRVAEERFPVAGRMCRNLIADSGGPGPRLLVGAHYDTVPGSPGADDNATGVAALLALAGELPRRRPAPRLRLAAFVNEEPPYFQSEAMGSRVHARNCRRRGEALSGAVALDGLGYFSDREGSQGFPLPASGASLPEAGNFLGLVANEASSTLLEGLLGAMDRHASLPVLGTVLPEWAPGVGWSDHWAFWQEGWPGVMVTDTLPFRHPHYHEPGDTPDRLDTDRLSRSVAGLIAAVAELAPRGR